MIYKSENDGIDHINIYSKGQTELGRWLSNFAFSPIETKDGHFNSIEGYWYWLISNNVEKEKLREVFGWNAKDLGRKLTTADYDFSKEFSDKIKEAISIKLQSNIIMLKILKESILPFAHYYVYGTKIVQPKNCEWIIEHIENIRKS